MMDDYGVASASNQRLSAADWMQKQYGAGWQGKKGKNFQGGTLSAMQGPMAEQIQNQIANASPGTTIQSQLMNQGQMPGAGNDAFTQWLQTAYVPQQEAEYNRLVQGGNPALNARDFAASLDITKHGGPCRPVEPVSPAQCERPNRRSLVVVGVMPRNVTNVYSGVTRPNEPAQVSGVTGRVTSRRSRPCRRAAAPRRKCAQRSLTWTR